MDDIKYWRRRRNLFLFAADKFRFKKIRFIFTLFFFLGEKSDSRLFLVIGVRPYLSYFNVRAFTNMARSNKLKVSNLPSLLGPVIFLLFEKNALGKMIGGLFFIMLYSSIKSLF